MGCLTAILALLGQDFMLPLLASGRSCRKALEFEVHCPVAKQSDREFKRSFPFRLLWEMRDP
eukprot:646847-Rhodomonas_salina.3